LSQRKERRERERKEKKRKSKGQNRGTKTEAPQRIVVKQNQKVKKVYKYCNKK
jgi:hypothetical protein